jgi:Outer membrane protein beta-barrel domain
MHENEFEKQVREKMDQLGFNPSESVWTGVDKEINKEKKRHVPLFWMFFLSGLLLAGGAYFFVTNKNASNTIAKAQQQRGINKKQDALSANKVEEPDKRNKVEKVTIQKGVNHNSLASISELDKGSHKKSMALKSGNVKLRSDGIIDIDRREIKKPRQNSISEKGDDIVIEHYSSKTIKTESENDSKKSTDSSAGKNITAVLKNNNSKQDSVADSNVAKVKSQKTKSSPWKIGITGGAGISNINQSLFKSVTAANSNYNLGTVPGAPSGSIANYSPSEISPGFSFAAGAFVNRDLSKRISFSAGIGYHYYSTKINTGSKVNSVLYANSASGQLFSLNNYYQNGNDQTHTNQYYFIELPLSFNFQLNKNKLTPFIWELGLSLGYMISNNALYYDPYVNVYIANYQQPNKMQLNGVTAIMFGFHLHKNELQIGPQLQYGLTGLLKSDGGNPGHLLYGGLKISIIP